MQFSAPDALERARRIRLMIFDVDGVLTDGRLWYASDGRELKAFHSFDGLGVKLLAGHGIKCAILSGRESPAVAARAEELGIKHVMQGIEDKRAGFRQLLARTRLKAESSGYMGDDLVDIPVLRRCGFACVPKEAPEQVRRNAHYICSSAAGHGAVRDVCEFILQAQGKLEDALREYFK
jgi:3-deoxy-D-manno-octulosonate 8-phosphate phosphatase (KDO 8-P phosphatase)